MLVLFYFAILTLNKCCSTTLTSCLLPLSLIFVFIAPKTILALKAIFDLLLLYYLFRVQSLELRHPPLIIQVILGNPVHHRPVYLVHIILPSVHQTSRLLFRLYCAHFFGAKLLLLSLHKLSDNLVKLDLLINVDGLVFLAHGFYFFE